MINIKKSFRNYITFLRDAPSPLLFVIAKLRLNHKLRKCTGWYKLHKWQEKNQPPNLHGHQSACQKMSEKELETLIPVMRIYNQDIGM